METLLGIRELFYVYVRIVRTFVGTVVMMHENVRFMTSPVMVFLV